MNAPLARSTRNAVGIVLGLGWLMTVPLVPAAAQDAMATVKMPAELTVAAPAARADGYLDIAVTSFTPPRQGAVSAVVSIVDGDGRKHEVGRFSIFPAEAFVAKTPAEARTFRLDARDALAAVKAKGPLKVLVQLTPDDGAGETADSAVTIGRATFVPPP